LKSTGRNESSQIIILMGACRNSFLGVFFLFLARIAFQSSFFSESRSFTRPLFCFFVPDLDRLAGQPFLFFLFVPDLDPDFFDFLRRIP
jgi:hypothetical protein